MLSPAVIFRTIYIVPPSKYTITSIAADLTIYKHLNNTKSFSYYFQIPLYLAKTNTNVFAPTMPIFLTHKNVWLRLIISFEHNLVENNKKQQLI